MVDERTGYKVSNFYETKRHMVGPICAQFEKWQQAHQVVKVVWITRNHQLKVIHKVNIQFEYSSKDKPQKIFWQNWISQQLLQGQGQ